MTPPTCTRFRELFDLHYDFIWRLLGRLDVPGGEIDDAAQEVFVVAARRFSDIQPGSERAFLFGVARRLASEARRGLRLRQNASSDRALEALPHPDASPEDALATRDARGLLDEVLEAMADDTREAFVLFELEELSRAEVADLLGIAEGTAASRLRRGRQQFFAASKRIKARLSRSEGGDR